MKNLSKSDKLISSGVPISWVKNPDLTTFNHFLLEGQPTFVLTDELALDFNKDSDDCDDGAEIALKAAACKAAAAAAALALCELGVLGALGAAAAAVKIFGFLFEDK